MINKYYDYGGYTPTGEKIVTVLDQHSLIKEASADSPIQQFWKTLTKSDICSYLHVIAMSAGEYYGPNRRGDYFREADLIKDHQLFVTQAQVFKHHINKPGSPTYGKVLFAYYNDHMHRVELILQIDKDKAPDIVEKIEQGDDIFVSMGVNVKSDTCSICGFVATSNKDRCSHVKQQLNMILENGKKVYTISTPPLNLFDISIVTRPADQIAWAMKKIAEDTQDAEQFSHLAPEIEDSANYSFAKIADIFKRIDGKILKYKYDDGLVDRIADNADAIPESLDIEDALLHAVDYKPLSTLKTMVDIGLTPNLKESAHLISKSVFKEDFTPEMRDLAIAALPEAFDILETNPGLLTELPERMEESLSEEDSSVDSIALGNLVEKHAELEDLYKVAGILSGAPVTKDQLDAGYNRWIMENPDNTQGFVNFVSGTAVGNTRMIPFTDPATGQEYKTNVMALRQSSRSLPGPVASVFTNNILSSALAVAGFVIMGRNIFYGNNSGKRNLLGAGLVAAGVALHKDNGLGVNRVTPGRIDVLEKVGANFIPTLAIAAPAALALDYTLNKKRIASNPQAFQSKTPGFWKRHGLGEFAAENPATSVIGLGLGLATGKKILSKPMNLIKKK